MKNKEDWLEGEGWARSERVVLERQGGQKRLEKMLINVSLASITQETHVQQTHQVKLKPAGSVKKG